MIYNKFRNQRKTLNSITLKHCDVKNFIREFLGFSPYEKKIFEYISVGKDKKALKIAKKKLGNINRSKKKRDLINLFQRKKSANNS